jgi:hypothetical protein
MANRLFNQFLFSFTKMLTSIHGQIVLQQAVKATKTAQGMTYLADAFGAAGNLISVELVDGATAGAEVVTVTGSTIVVEIEDGVTTQAQLKAALDGDTAAAALISVSVASGSTPVAEAASVFLAGGTDGVKSCDIKGATCARTGVGEYTVTLTDKFAALMDCQLTLEAATAVDLVPQIKSHDVSSAKTIVFRLLAGATPTEVAAASTVHFKAFLRNSSVAK